jgi:hypothetical protein
VGASPSGPGNRLSGVALVVADEDGERVVLDEFEATLLLELTGRLDGATVSACFSCRSRVVAVIAFLELLEDALAHERARELIELAEEAPTLHLYIADAASDCTHRTWRDPLYDEWADAFAELPPVGKLAP